jgi:hypothetical protein
MSVLDDRLYFKKGYKYQLAQDFMGQTKIFPPEPIDHEFIYLTTNGVLILKKGYAWDGCSGPTIDDNTNMIAGAKHDACYQLMRAGLLDLKWKDPSDDQFEEDIHRDSGRVKRPWYLRWWKTVDNFRAEYFEKGVEYFGMSSAKPQKEEIFVAP